MDALGAFLEFMNSNRALRSILLFFTELVYLALSALPILALAGLIAVGVWAFHRLASFSRWAARRLQRRRPPDDPLVR